MAGGSRGRFNGGSDRSKEKMFTPEKMRTGSAQVNEFEPYEPDSEHVLGSARQLDMSQLPDGMKGSAKDTYSEVDE